MFFFLLPDESPRYRVAHGVFILDGTSHIFGKLFLCCVENEELTQMVTLCFHWQYFCVFVGTRIKLLECIFVISKGLIEFDPFGID